MFVTIQQTYCTFTTDFVRHTSASIVSNYVRNSIKVNVERTTMFRSKPIQRSSTNSIGNSKSHTNRIHLQGNYGAS